MKVARTYTIDHEIVEKMQHLNASDLINGLLKDHFAIYSYKNSVLEAKKASIKEIMKKKSNFLEKLRLLISGIHLISIVLLRRGLKPGRILLRTLKLLLTSTEEDFQLVQKTLKLQQTYLKCMKKSSDEKIKE